MTCMTCGSMLPAPSPKGGRPRKYCHRSRCNNQSIEKKPRLPRPRNLVLFRCAQCSKEELRCPSEAKHKTCSKGCQNARAVGRRLKTYRRRRFEHSCSGCGAGFTSSHQSNRFCRKCTRRRGRSGGGHKHSDRARRFGLPRTVINPVEIFERDGWRCQLCGRVTPSRLRGSTDPSAPELDHIVPLGTRRGLGHVRENVQCACRACNSKKGMAIRGQMRLL